MLEHVPFEGPGHIEAWANRRGADISSTRFHEAGWYLPAAGEIDLLVVMGGPMSVYEDHIYSWLELEKLFLKDCIAAGCKIVGVCLGAQMAADALGARVYTNKHKEVGWFPVHKTATPHAVLQDMPETTTVFHWHGDTFDLPDGALHLAYSDACAHQAFIWKEQVLGLQYHMEMGREHIDAMLDNCEHELQAAGDYMQSAYQIREGFSQAGALPAMLEGVLDRFAA
jgi:GMP synthase-like glutamine amidotransferase